MLVKIRWICSLSVMILLLSGTASLSWAKASMGVSAGEKSMPTRDGTPVPRYAMRPEMAVAITLPFFSRVSMSICVPLWRSENPSLTRIPMPPMEMSTTGNWKMVSPILARAWSSSHAWVFLRLLSRFSI